MGFMASRGNFYEARNDSHWLYQKHPSFTIPTFSENTNWDTAAMCMSVAEEAIIKSTGSINAPLEFWLCTNPPRYYVDRFHTYKNYTNKTDPDVSERTKRSIQEYTQGNSAMRGNMGPQGIQQRWGQTDSATERSMFTDHRAQLTQSWNIEGFSDLYQALLMCKMVYPYTSRTTRVACASATKTKFDNILGDIQKRGHDEQGEGFYHGEISQIERGSFQNSDQSHIQVILSESPKKMK